MKKNSLIFGTIAGLICTAWIFASLILFNGCPDKYGMIYGFSIMIIAFSMIFVGIKNYRDKLNGGQIGFGKAFLIGLNISLIASTIYVIAWAIDYHFFIPDFLDRYFDHELRGMKADNASAAELQEAIADMESMKESYKNPLVFIAYTYVEILPVGLLISLVSALILKTRSIRKIPQTL